MQAPLQDWITDSIRLFLKFIFVMIMSFGSFINFSVLAISVLAENYSR